LVRAARALHYHDRHWPLVLAGVRWSANKKAAFEAHRRQHPQDVKAADARACLLAAKELCETARPKPPQPLRTLSTWAHREWLAAQGAPPPGDAEAGLRT